jgi:DNA repair exonuclease SbcCD ATPase subunit
MIFDKIEADHFMSFKRLAYSYPTKGLYFIGGEKTDSRMSNSNGAGKSAFTEALCWGLFGKTIRNSDKDDVVNWDEKRNCAVAVSFVDDYEREYTVLRFRKHEEGGNDLFLFQGKKDLTQSDSRKTQEEINKALGMNWLVFSTAVIFGEKARRFAEARDAEKKEVFDEIMMFQSYLEAQQKVKDEKKKVESLISTLEDEISTKQALHEKYVEEADELEDKLGAAKEAQLQSDKQIQSAKKTINSLTRTLKKLVDKMEELDETEKDLRRGDEELQPYRDKMGKARVQELSDIEGQCNKVNEELVVLQSQINEHKKWLSEDVKKIKVGMRCAKCKQLVKDIEEAKKHERAHLKKAEKKYEKINSELTLLKKLFKDKEDEWGEKIEKFDNAKLELETGLREIEKKFHECDKEKIDVEGQIKLAHSEIRNLEETGRKNVERIQSELKKKKKYIKELSQRLKEFAKEKEELTEQILYLDFWIEGFSNRGIKSLLIDEIIPELNNRIAYYASTLLDDSIRIEFDTETTLKSGETRDKFNIKLFKDEEEIQYEPCSSGEKGRIDTAILLALQNLIFNRSAKGSTIMILDEIFEHLDIIGIERTVNLLKEESDDKAIFVISHQNELQDYFENSIIIKNEEGISTLEG